jgi:hypothetical protein
VHRPRCRRDEDPGRPGVAPLEVVFIKELGDGTALAVLIDATIVRAPLVPSLMALLGKRNWWAPAPLRNLHNRLGLSEPGSPTQGDDHDVPSEPTP